MVERTKRDEELIVTGLIGLISDRISIADILMVEPAHVQPALKRFHDELVAYGLEVSKYEQEGIEFSEIFSNEYAAGLIRIQKHFGIGDKNE